LAINAARTVVGIDVGYHPSVLKPIVESFLASDLISLDDCIAQLSLSRSFPFDGICPKQLKAFATNKLNVKTIRVFISQDLVV
jgi:hypothetical protein